MSFIAFEALDKCRFISIEKGLRSPTKNGLITTDLMTSIVWSAYSEGTFTPRFCRGHFFHGQCRQNGLGMIQTHSIYCALYFYYYYISSTSDHQALDPRGWGPLL